jgi:predicted nucleotidyltransferase
MPSADLDALLGRELGARAPGLVAAYLFGSSARGDSRPDSDIDVALLYERPPPATLEAQPFVLAADLSSVLGRSVDLVVMNSAPPDLVHRVLRDGRLIVEHDRSARIAFEVRARSVYFDLLPALRRYRRREQTP